ncbi:MULTISPECIES: hypothetical protein [unclassified Crossiella]|uniref:hypothetical protein n=1 Tax=unclassified Crossiella TaxID=2620835 RepID=UPI001FFF17F0|nr:MULTISPECIES: hypothetical protein [unclassified Crossiella]MCK2237490.1 hypothetical protein [Crossiella sp. S99.2]MCK2254776.1 hypothetical protein [Crossiella sp. S99.1]
MNEMWHDEQDVRNALQRVVDTPAPAVRTDVAEVIRRGKRRVLVTRVGAVAGVVVAVGVIGLGATAISGSLFNGDHTALPPAATSSAPSTSRQPALDLPGWTQLETAPATSAPDATSTGASKLPQQYCSGPQTPPANGRAILPEDRYLPAFVEAVSKSAGERVKVSFQNYVNANRGHLAVVVPGKATPGTVRLEAGRFGGPPTLAAESYRYSSGVPCQEPLRRIRPDGAVLQLFQDEDYGGKQPTRRLGVYTPNGRFYNVTVTAGSLTSDGTPMPADKQVGMDGLALSREQVVQIGEAMADLG